MPAYYNEIEPFAAKWLRNLIDAGLIAPGDCRGEDRRVSVSVITGDCREVLHAITTADVVITNPVWPNCPEGLLAPKPEKAMEART